jgi:transposase
MADPAISPTLFVGIDIAATTATAAWLVPGRPPAKPVQIEQTPAGFATLHHALARTGHASAATHIALEATGTYWCRLAVDLHARGYQVSVLNPAQVHHFAQAQLRRNKTDPLDAQLLAEFAAALHPDRWTPPPQIYHELEQRLTLRQQLLTGRQQIANQLHALRAGAVVIEEVATRLEAILAVYDTQLAAVEAELRAYEPPDPAWAGNLALLLTIKGIGFWSAAWLLVATVNFTSCQRVEELVGYSGLAPCKYLSGTSVRGRERLRRGGHRRLRTTLYMASLSAARHNPAVRALYQRLVAAGKPKKLAHCAAARKLLHIAWGVVSKQQPYDPAYRQRPASAGEAAAA